jgi:hypothetical protein
MVYDSLRMFLPKEILDSCPGLRTDTEGNPTGLVRDSDRHSFLDVELTPPVPVAVDNCDSRISRRSYQSVNLSGGPVIGIL